MHRPHDPHPAWPSSLSRSIKCKVHNWAPTSGQEEQTEAMERCNLDLSNELEHDGKALLKQTSMHSKYKCVRIYSQHLQQVWRTRFNYWQGLNFHHLWILTQVCDKSKYNLKKIKVEATLCHVCLTGRITSRTWTWRGCVLLSEFALRISAPEPGLNLLCWH